MALLASAPNATLGCPAQKEVVHEALRAASLVPVSAFNVSLGCALAQNEVRSTKPST